MEEMYEKAEAKADIWHERLEAWKTSGLSMRSFCRREGVGLNGLRYWKRKFEPEQGRSSLVRVAVKAELLPTIEILIRRRFTVRVPAGFRAEELARLIGVLESLS